jgi:gluconate 5-dehydrogenase
MVRLTIGSVDPACHETPMPPSPDRQAPDFSTFSLTGNQGWAAPAAPFDVSAPQAIPEHVNRIAQRLGRLDGLVANAGFPYCKPLPEMSLADWRTEMATDLDSALVLAREAVVPTKAAGAGSIVWISSIMGSIGRPTISAYCAAKGALDAMMRSLAAELAPFNIRCNTIAPGFFETDATRILRENPEFHGVVCRRTLMGRRGTRGSLAPPRSSSDAASYVSGTVLTVDGGMTAVL